MTTLFTDSGVGSDANPIGGNYTTFTGFNALRRASNTIRGSTGSSNNGSYVNSVGDQTSSWIQASIEISAGNSAGIMLRCATAAANGYLFQVFGSNNVHIARWDAGSYTALATGTQAYTDNDVLYFEAVGTVLTAKVNASTVLTYDTVGDGTIYSTGRFGIYTFVDNEPLDTITAGDFGGGGIAIPVVLNQFRRRES